MYVMPTCFNAGDTIYFPFDAYDTNGASVTISGLAVTDIEIYKNGSTTQRASDNGYTLLDTDGIDFDGTTGLHGFSIDTSDNSDASFYADGSQYWVNINAITIDGQTVRFTYFLALGYTLRPTTAGRKLDVSAGGEAGLDWANVGSPTTTNNLSGTTINIVNTATTVTNRVTANMDQVNGQTAESVPSTGRLLVSAYSTYASAIEFVAQTGTGALPANASGIRSAVGLASANLDTQLTTIDDFLDTEVAAIKAKTDGLNFTGSNVLALLANGVTHGGSTAILQGERMIFASVTTNEPAFKLTGNGTAPGLLSTGGATGNGAKFLGGASGGAGFRCEAQASTYQGIYSLGVGSGGGVRFEGGDTGAGLNCLGGVTSGAGILAQATSDAEAFKLGTSGTGVLLGLPGTGWENAIADAVLTRDVSNVEASANDHSLCFAVLAMSEASLSGTTLTVKKTDGSTTFATKTISTASRDPIASIT